MDTTQIIISVLFVIVISVVSYYFGKYDGYRMGIEDAIRLSVITVEKAMECFSEDGEYDEAE